MKWFWRGVAKGFAPCPVILGAFYIAMAPDMLFRLIGLVCIFGGVSMWASLEREMEPFATELKTEGPAVIKIYGYSPVPLKMNIHVSQTVSVEKSGVPNNRISFN